MTDPRIERSRTLVRRAALEELAARGYGAFSIEAVARRSGVAKSTVYRLWRTRIALIADAIETLNVQPPPQPTQDDPRARVEGIVRHLAEAFTGSPVARCLPALIEAAEHDPEVRALHHGYTARRRQALRDALAEGVRRGAFPAHVDPDAASQALAGAILYSRVMTPDPYPADRVAALVTTVLGPAPGH